MRKILILTFLCCVAPMTAQNGITNTQGEKARMTSVPLTAVQWTGGFWGERFDVFSHTSVQSMWETWQSAEGKGFNNFLIAAGEKQGEHHGPPFHDGDMYKWLEAVASVYAVTHDPQLEQIRNPSVRTGTSTPPSSSRSATTDSPPTLPCQGGE